MTDDSAIELSIKELATDAPVDSIAELYGKVQYIQRRANELMELLEARMTDYIRANGPIEWACDDQGHVQKFWLGHSKSVKCRDMNNLLQFFIRERSIEDLSGCLSSNAFKHGQFRKLCPDKFDVFFETVTKDKLESGEQLPKSLLSMNTKFITT